MKKVIIGIIAGVILTFAGTTIASRLQPDIDGASFEDWIQIGRATSAKRFIDKDYNLVCWISNPGMGGGISCVQVDNLE